MNILSALLFLYTKYPILLAQLLIFKLMFSPSEEHNDWARKEKSPSKLALLLASFPPSFKLSKDAVNAAAEIKIPLLLFQAEHDDFVKPSGQNIFAGKLSNCTLIKVAGSKHDIFREKDEILIPYMEKIISFIN